jgi:hypothetical protein
MLVLPVINNYLVDEKRSSVPRFAGLPSSLPAFWLGRLIAAYVCARLIPRDFGRLASERF